MGIYRDVHRVSHAEENPGTSLNERADVRTASTAGDQGIADAEIAHRASCRGVGSSKMTV